jgi:hypothetical protein
MHVVDFFAPATSVPPAPELPPDTEQSPLALALDALLSYKPVWTPASLLEAAPPGTSRPALEDAARAACYRFRNGPWRGAWVRKGYNPRVDPGAGKYQVVHYRLPREWWVMVDPPTGNQLLGLLYIYMPRLYKVYYPSSPTVATG